jgi:limonene-1,2-epoxide hydrolase
MVNIAANGPIVLTERVDVLSGPWVYLDIWVCGTFEVRDGRIILWRDYFDLAEATAKLAVGPVRRLLGLTR